MSTSGSRADAPLECGDVHGVDAVEHDLRGLRQHLRDGTRLQLAQLDQDTAVVDLQEPAKRDRKGYQVCKGILCMQFITCS